LAWKKFIGAGSYFIHKNQKDLAYTLFKYSRKIASNEDENFDSIFKLVWGHLLTKDFKESMKVIEKERLIQKFDKLPSKLQYWVVVACEKNNEINLAKYLYKQLIDNSPLNFYSIMALNNIKKLQPNSKRKRTNDNIYKSTPFYNLPIKHFDVNFLSSLHRLQIWIDSGIEKFIPQEISSILSSNKKDVVTNQKISKELNQKEFKKQITLNLIHLLAFKGKHLQTFKLVYRSLNKNLFALTDKTIKFLFPFHYLSQIQKIEKDLDPIIILSLIRQESAFNPSARSIAGARGLMQIMPNTARMYKKKMKVSQLKNPEFNLKIGIKFLKSLLNRYDGNLIYALAAYNAGPTRLRKWTMNLFSSEDPLMIIESIPYKETRNYVKLIYRNIYFYQILTNNKIIITDPENVFQVSEFSKSN
jgi:soluble lytic murein transglycosylase